MKRMAMSSNRKMKRSWKWMMTTQMKKRTN
jgi:hypothetical protein